MTSPTSTDERRPVPAIDPRIRARRIAVQRDVGRRRLHRLGFVAGAAAVALGAVGLALSPLLDVDRVVVVGAGRVDPGAVRRAAGIDPGDPLVTLDAAGAATRVRAVPWVATAAVERAWPGTVRIAVVEREPVAGLLRGDGRAALVDLGGRVLADVPAGEAGVLLVSGLAEPGPPGSTVADATGALDVARSLPASLLARTGGLHVEQDGTMALRLALAEGEEPALVALGDDQRLAEKLTALTTVLASVPLDDLAVIDVAVPSAPALTRR